MRAMDRVEHLFLDDANDCFVITNWPRWLRRVFILTLPISGPLYVATFFIMIFAFVASVLVAVIIDAWE